VIITATGRPGVVPAEIFDLVEDGTVVANIGHFPWEIDVEGLRARASAVQGVGAAIERVELPGGRHVILLADGRMLNLAGSQPKGNSIDSMDLGFMLQALSLERVASGADGLVPGPQGVPDDIERRIAREVLEVMGASR
jgi:adenosylhomocysteinase